MVSQTDLDQYTKSIRLTNQAKLLTLELKLVTQKMKRLKKEINLLQEKAHEIQLNVIPSHPWTTSNTRKENSYENSFGQIFSEKQIKKLQALGKKLKWNR